MSEPKHTPGPDMAAQIESDRAIIAELLAALKGLLLSADASWEDNRGGHDWPEACEAARTAIAKAESR